MIDTPMYDVGAPDVVEADAGVKRLVMYAVAGVLGAALAVHGGMALVGGGR